MKGDIAFAGFVLTAGEWQELDSESRAQLIAVATRKEDPWLAGHVFAPDPQQPLAEGSGPFELEEFIDLEIDPE
jgi:hypothetical protein